MTNVERQQSLDRKKWEESEIAERDLAGEMAYCRFCKFREEGDVCALSQETREVTTQCARAFNTMIRRGQAGKSQ